MAILDLGSVNAPPPLDHRDSGVDWSASYKPQAASGKLDRKLYIG